MTINKVPYGEDIDGNRGIIINEMILDDEDHEEIKQWLLEQMEENEYKTADDFPKYMEYWIDGYSFEIKPKDYI